MARWAEALSRYLGYRLPAARNVRVVPAGAMPAGASNATVPFDLLAECDGVAIRVPLILRPQRGAGILAPYDVARQYTIMRALARTVVPVPAVLWLESDPGVLGVPFFVMERLEDVRTPPLFWYRPGPMVDAAAAALAAVHAVDWRAAGLAVLCPEEARSPLAAELHSWRARAAWNGTLDDPLLVQLLETLLRNEPPDATFALTHGDTNAGNYLFRANAVAAVVDWELAAIGDPRSDLGFYAALEVMFGGGEQHDGETVLSQAYRRVTGALLTHLEFYEAWGHARMLMIFGGSRGGWWHPFGAHAALSRLDAILGRGWRR